MQAPIKTEITEGCSYYDSPQHEIIKPIASLCTPIARSIAESFGSALPEPISILTGYEMIRLRWMKSDGKGGLIPRSRK